MVAKTVKQLRGSGATGVDEIRPGYLKALDILGLSWLSLQHCVDIGGSTTGVVNRGGGSYP